MAGMLRLLTIAEVVSILAIMIGFLFWLRYRQGPK
jgi:hypothetical protein